MLFELKAMSCNDGTCQLKYIENFKGVPHIKAVSSFLSFCARSLVLKGIFRNKKVNSYGDF